MQNIGTQGYPEQTNMGATPAQPSEGFDASFRPTGAIAFFIALVITGLAIWFGIYFLMLERI